MKLAVLTTILSPYRIPLFESMRQRVEEFTVLLMAEHEENRLWKIGKYGFNTKLLPGIHFRTKGSDVSMHFNYGVLSSLRWLDPDLVLSGGFAPANLAALAYCKLKRRPFVCWGELTRRDLTAGSRLRRRLRRWIIARSDAALASSSEARETFCLAGVEETRILLSVMPIDVELFHARTLTFRHSPACRELRHDFPGPILLSVGRLVRSKGWPELLDIYERVYAVRPDVSLVIVGDGPERGRYEAMVRNKGYRHVCFTGFLQQDQLIPYLAASDVFVFPTLYDPFGAVLSEAMAAELPAISSVHACSTRDLVQDGVTGFRIDPRETRSSAETILRVLDMPGAQRAEMGKAAYRFVSRYDVEPSAEAIVGFLKGLGRLGSSADHQLALSAFKQGRGV